MCTWALISAGIIVLPVRSTWVAPAGTATWPLRPTAVMRPFCTTTAPSSIGTRASPMITRAPSYTAAPGACASAVVPIAMMTADSAKPTATATEETVFILRFERLVDQRREFAPEVGGVRQHLHHEADHQVCVGIDAVGRAVGARPSERAGRVESVGAEPIGGFEAEPVAHAVRRMQRADLVGRHQRHRPPRENAHAVERATAADHLEETRVVLRGRQQTRAAGETLARAVDVGPLAARTVRRALDLAVGIALIHRREPRPLPRRQEELRVPHVQRTGDPRLDELV